MHQRLWNLYTLFLERKGTRIQVVAEWLEGEEAEIIQYELYHEFLNFVAYESLKIKESKTKQKLLIFTHIWKLCNIFHNKFKQLLSYEY